ncbi:Hypothetical_protein [Hexamita inflata]|uniref:Hypothetical_protein n=1 Tax=Hexamita inflata TaxID=28002 RepID=A0AA86UES4_9EUKA|nr:Hypothetical protein HINF_LOCUS35927 [Hexamita inflata]
MQCISCSAKFGPGSVIKSNNEGTCKCDTNNGFAGTDGVCNDCWKIGLKVAEGGAKCEENCLDDLVRSQDGLSCITCAAKFGAGSIVNQTDKLKCMCDRNQGFAGDADKVCSDCWKLGQEVQAYENLSTYCKPCSEAKVLQGELAQRTCKVCTDTNQVPSTDNMQCISCSAKFGPGSVIKSNNEGTCKCDTNNGFAGTDGVCNDCWKIGLKVAEGGAKCEENCLDDLVRSQDGLSCITCAAKFGAGSIVNQTDKLKCMCDRNQGFAGDADKVCSDCWKLGQEVQAYENLSTYCKPCSEAKVLQGELAQRTCKVCTDTNQVPSTDNMQCISCSAKFGPGSVIKSNNEGTCKCDTNNGFAGTDGVCNDCWKIGLKVAEGGAKCEENCLDDLVRSQDGLSCITCAAKFGAGSIYDNENCICNEKIGFAGAANMVCSNCWANYNQIDKNECIQCKEDEEFDPISHKCTKCRLNEIFSPEENECVCDYTSGFTGTPGNCYCNTHIGFTKGIDPTTSKAICKCNSYLGNVEDKSNTYIKTCMCDVDSGHFGDPGNCVCDTAFGNIGLPGHCQCNPETHHIGRPGHCECDSVNGYYGLMEPIKVLINYVQVQMSTCVNIVQDNENNNLLTKDTCFSKKQEVYEVLNFNLNKNGESYIPSKKYDCVPCYPGELFDEKTNKCIILIGSILEEKHLTETGMPVRKYKCNNKEGFAGANLLKVVGDKCSDCWTTSQVIESDKCNKCEDLGVGYAFDLDTFTKDKLGKCTCNSQHKVIAGSGITQFTCECNEMKNFIGTAGKCVDCAAKNAHAYTVNFKLVCQCNGGPQGYGKLNVNDDSCVPCKTSNYIVSLIDNEYICRSCGVNQGVSVTDPTKCVCDIAKNYNLAPKIDGTCSCMDGYHISKDVCSKNTNKSTVAAAVCVPIAVLIVIGALSLFYIKKQQQKKAKVEANITTDIPLPTSTNSDTIQINEAGSSNENSDKVAIEEINNNQIVEQADIVLNENVERDDQVIK